jgi:hypothetical protein
MSLERQEFRERPADHPLGGDGERAWVTGELRTHQ